MESHGLTREQVAFGIATMRVESGFNPAAKGPSTTEKGLGQFNDRTWKEAVKEYNKNFRGKDEPKIDPSKDRADTEAQIKVTGAWTEKVWTEASKVSDDPRLKGFTLSEIAYGMWHEGIGNVSGVADYLKGNPKNRAEFNETYGKAWLIDYSHEHSSGNLPQRSDVLTANTLKKIMDVIIQDWLCPAEAERRYGVKGNMSGG